MTRIRRATSVSMLALGLILGTPSRPTAHEIPADVTIRAIVRAEGDRLRVLVRVPLEAMRDFAFPTRGPGYLDLDNLGNILDDAAQLWVAGYVQFREEDRVLPDETVAAVRVSLPSDPSFRSWSEALAHIEGPSLPNETQLVWEQALLDVLLEVPIESASARFSIEPEWSHLGLRTLTVLRFITSDGTERVFQYTGHPGVVRLDPRWHQAAWRFIKLGFQHILAGIDHLLFILCLVIPFRRFGPLVPIVTSFTVAHSITLIASAMGLAPGGLWFPPLIETLIALSIVYMAIENITGARMERRWLLAFGFGLVHGFGFSFLLRESLQFAGGHLLSSLLFFNVGVELGQLFILILTIPVLDWLFRKVVAERTGTIILSALIAHTAWHWMTERGSQLLLYDIRWSFRDLGLAAALRWLMLGLILVGAVWALSGLYRWLAARTAEGEGEGAEG